MRQIDQILAEVNYQGPPVRLVKCLAVHNEEDWIDYNLRNCYEEFDIIRIVEGAVVGRPNSTSDGHSTDSTLDRIRSFPDPANKIELYTGRRHFKSLEEQKQTFLDHASEGEILFIIDCDEFYLDGEPTRIRNIMEKRPTILEIVPTFLHFYRDFTHIRDYEDAWNLWHQRIIRYQDGLRYHTHPVATDKSGKCTYFSPEYQSRRYMANLNIFHYGHVKSKEFHIKKAEFYKSELSKFEGAGGNASIEFDAKLDEFLNHKEDLGKILHYDGPHPRDLDSHPLRTLVDEFYKNKTIRHFMESEAYSDKLPTIPQWMKYQKRMTPVFNLIEG